MKNISLLCIAAALSLSAMAQERAFLSKAEVEALTAGKKWVHLRAEDNNKVRWDLRDNGMLYGNNLTTNGSDSGRWSVNDQGQLCVKWRGRSVDRCVAVLKDGDKLQMVDSNNLQGSYAELTLE